MARREFRDKTVVITGGAGGIGAALGRRFAQEGARIVLVDVNEERLAEAAEGLVDVQTLVCDITDAEACEAALGRLPVDVLVNNAGITHRSAFKETPAAVLRRVVEVNLFGAMNCTQAVLPGLLARQGLVVVMSSVAGLGPLDARAGYSASKHALHGMFETLRSELRGTGVDVMMVCPSFVDTGIATKNLDGEHGRPGTARATIGEVLTPNAVADQIVRAAKRSRRTLLPTWTARLSYLLSRLAPGFYERRMAAGVRDELRKAGS